MATTNFDDSGYTHNFQDRINEANQQVANKEQQYQQYQTRADESYKQQQDALANRQAYSDILSQAKESEGVGEAKSQYQKDLEAVNAVSSAMNTLPSSINANSNVTLTNAQRQAALGNQMNKYLNSYDYATRQAETSGNLYQMAQNAAFTAAEAGATDQQQNIANAMNQYNSNMAYLQDMYNQVANARQESFNTYGQMYEDEYQHMQDQLQREMQAEQIAATQRIAEMEDATKRWIQQQQSADSRYAADASLRAAQYMQSQNSQPQNYKSWDFGGGYALTENPYGGSIYTKNGNPISAGEFLEATGANGANWDLWNDVWNQGVSTQGVGSDTVQAFSGMSPSSKKYNYLFGM